MKELDDQKLVNLVVREDNRQAFEELVNRHKGGVFAFLHRMLGRSQEIEDVAQNIFIAAYRGLRTFNHEAKFSTWLYRITYNQACTNLRRNQTGKLKMLVQLPEDEMGNVKEFPDSAGRDPEKSAQQKQVWKFVEQLPSQAKAVIELYYGKGLNYSEIADALTLPVGTVKTHMHRAKQKLREVMTEKLHAENVS